MKIKASCSNGANWKQVNVKSRIPKELDKLEEWPVICGGHGAMMPAYCSAVWTNACLTK